MTGQAAVDEKTNYYLPGSTTEEEISRLDSQHHIFVLVRNGLLYEAPVSNKPLLSIVDLGCGTGVWTRSVAQTHPQAKVIGVDITPPSLAPDAPPNLHFVKTDLTKPDWDFAKENGPFDLIHARLLDVGIEDWPALYRQCFECLKVGGGIQFGHGRLQPISEDGLATSENSPYLHGCEELRRTLRELEIGYPAHLDPAENMKKAGFADVTPIWLDVPVGGWPEDPKLRETGEYSLINQKGLLVRLGKALAKELDETEGKELLNATEEAAKDIELNATERRYIQR